MSIRPLLPPILLLWALAQPAGAALLGFTDQTQWTTSTSGLTQIDFEVNTPKGNPRDGDGRTSYAADGNIATFSGVTFSGSGSLFTTDPKYAANLYGWRSGDVLSDEGGEGVIEIDLQTGITAFGVDLGSFSPFESDVEVTVTTSDQTHSFTVATERRPTWSFFGVVSDREIFSITLDAISSSDLVIDNFSFGSNAATSPPTGGVVVGGQGNLSGPAGVDGPAVSTLLLLGLITLRQVTRSRRKRRS